MNVEVLADDQPDNSFDDAMVIWLDVQLFLLLQESFSVSASVDALIVDKTIKHFKQRTIDLLGFDLLQDSISSKDRLKHIPKHGFYHDTKALKAIM